MNIMTEQFTWTPIYQELADELVKWQDRQKELIAFLEELREKQYIITPLNDKDEDGARFLLSEIDPFTFLGVFNRNIRFEQRIGILTEIKKFFNLHSPIPSDLLGIPALNNLKSWFIAYKMNRDLKDIERLWNVFRLALIENPLYNEEFLSAFDEALNVKGTNVNLTIGLFWIRPLIFLSLDSKIRTYLDINLPKEGISSQFYVKCVEKAYAERKPIPELSHSAWLKPQESLETKTMDIDYWLVGAYWDGQDPPDQTKRFLAEGIWENGYRDRLLDIVNSMKVGDKIAIKSSSTQRNDLPFDNQNKTVSRMNIKAIGTIVSNWGDGRTLEVEWEPSYKERIWYFYTHRATIWHLRPNKENKWSELANQLIDFVWYGKDQDYNYFINIWWASDKNDVDDVNEPYSIEDMVASGIFLTHEEISSIVERLREKKAMIIQGSPGVGKTFIAKKLAYALMEEKDPERVEFVQFHQSYSYDDFVRGYRPIFDKAGSFGLQDGIFLEFCKKAINDPEEEYIFIIDEINRGNLSQIFGELLMLIESDKRGKEFAVPLVYRKEDEPRFYVPSNLYLIGLINLADRSLAMVDYALRRRFSFVTLQPQFSSELFHNWLSERSMIPDLLQLIVSRISAINKVIRDDSLLGENYQIGHSYFCPRGDDFSGLDIRWYQGIVKTEIIPLLKEYWFDNPGKANEAERMLLA